MQYSIRHGIAPEHVGEAARLYAIAFEKKFEKLLGPPEVVTDLLKDGINAQYAFSAVSPQNELLGIVGYNQGGNSLMNINCKKLIQKYGLFKGLYKKMVLALLFYKKRDDKNQLLMDGIVVTELSRGKGIGGRLIEKLVEFAKQNNMNSIKLDVVDGNRAKKLYLENKFVETHHIKNIALIKNLIGVSGLSTMVRKW